MPIFARRRAGQSPDGAAQPTRASGRRVLVIDDNEDAAGALLQLLKREGNDAHGGPRRGGRRARSDPWRPEVILLDIGLPKLNGYEARRRLRAHSATAGARIIALTGWGQEQDRQNSADAGFDAHLVKPVDYDELDRFYMLSAVAGARARDGAGEAHAGTPAPGQRQGRHWRRTTGLGRGGGAQVKPATTRRMEPEWEKGARSQQ